jgi:hypothetical protein
VSFRISQEIGESWRRCPLEISWVSKLHTQYVCCLYSLGYSPQGLTSSWWRKPVASCYSNPVLQVRILAWFRSSSELRNRIKHLQAIDRLRPRHRDFYINILGFGEQRVQSSGVRFSALFLFLTDLVFNHFRACWRSSECSGPWFQRCFYQIWIICLCTVRQTLCSVADLERFRCVRMSRSGECTSESVCRCRWSSCKEESEAVGKPSVSLNVGRSSSLRFLQWDYCVR